MNPSNLVDTHCHIQESPFIENLPYILQQCQVAGVCTIVAIGTDVVTSQQAITLSQQYPQSIVAAVGIHPQIVEDDMYSYWEILEKFAQEKSVRAVGEIGLDFEVKVPSHSVQEQRFRRQLHLAYRYQLPVLIHCRSAFGKLQEIIQEFYQQYGYSIGGILHSWAGSWESLQFFLPLGFYCGVSGVITHPYTTKRRKILQQVPLEYIVLETDAPYIGTTTAKKGESAPYHLPEIAQAVSELHQVPYQVVCEQTSTNARKVLKLDQIIGN